MVRVLIAEGDSSLRKNIRALLESSGYFVLEAENGFEALQLIESELPDLVLSETQIPLVDGFELLEKLKEKALYPMIPLIFISTRADLTDIREAMNKGAADYMVKPFKAKELLEAVRINLEKNALLISGLNKFRDQIAMNFSHELRTPLTPILGYSQYLKEYHSGLSKEEIEEACAKIQVSGNRMLRLVNKLLLLIETLCIASDKKKIQDLRESGRADAGAIITETVYEIAARFSRTRDILVSIEDSGLRITDSYLEIIISELVENALKYSPEGSTVTISTEVTDDIYKFNIANQGCGFTKQDIKKHYAFDQFERENFTTAGLGVGFSLVKNILEIFDGKLEIDNEYKKYTDIKVSLPLVSN